MSIVNQKSGIRRSKILLPMILLLLTIAASFVIAGCYTGTIVILENPYGTGFTMELKEWDSKNKCELSLNEGDVLEIEVALEEGEVDLTIKGANGAEPYAGKDVKSIKFTVTVSQTDRYIIYVTGNHATGKITAKK